MLTLEQRKHLEPIESELRKRGALDFPINTLEPQKPRPAKVRQPNRAERRRRQP